VTAGVKAVPLIMLCTESVQSARRLPSESGREIHSPRSRHRDIRGKQQARGPGFETGRVTHTLPGNASPRFLFLAVGGEILTIEWRREITVKQPKTALASRAGFPVSRITDNEALTACVRPPICGKPTTIECKTTGMEPSVTFDSRSSRFRYQVL
jgi:hypothetical protein